nr:PPE family protein [Mycobacterium canetti]
MILDFSWLPPEINSGMMGRGGANPHVVQARPSVVPRVGIG